MNLQLARTYFVGEFFSMLLGEIYYKVGQKHRMALPKKFRDELGSEIVATRGYEGCLILVSLERWLSLMAGINAQSFFTIQARQTARFLLGGAAELTLDDQGRFVLPESLFEHAGLTVEVVFVGLGTWVEIWDSERWKAQQVLLQQDGAEIAQTLETRLQS
jgi:MraZ protein